MVKLIGPMMSLSASGTFSKDLNFYHGSAGPVARRIKRSFTAPGQIWYVNRDFFLLAVERWKTLNAIQQKAWVIYYGDICDTARDRYIGMLIANGLLYQDWYPFWPTETMSEIVLPRMGRTWTDIAGMMEFASFDNYAVLAQKRICGFRWYNGPSSENCDEAWFKQEGTNKKITVSEAQWTEDYVWARAYRIDGSLTVFMYVGSTF